MGKTLIIKKAQNELLQHNKNLMKLKKYIEYEKAYINDKT